MKNVYWWCRWFHNTQIIKMFDKTIKECEHTKMEELWAVTHCLDCCRNYEEKL